MFERLENKLQLESNPVIFFISAGIILVFVVVAAAFNQALATFFGAVTTFIATYLGWFYILVVTCLLIFLVWIGLSRHGSVRLGPDDARPEYSNLAWFTMLFAAGIGTILMFWGVAEPISHFGEPPMGNVQSGTPAAAQQAMNITLYHFGLHTWTIFAMPGLALAYFVYRHNLPLRISSIFYGVLGERIYGPIGWTIDIIAVVGTMFGVATSLGLGTLQIGAGLNHLTGMPNSPLSQFGIIAFITAIATTSVVLGLDRGIRRLSLFNITLAVLLLLFVFITGPTLFIMQSMVQTIGSYLSELPRLAFWNQAYNDTGWQQDWTVFYWAWTISWAPFVGIFIARISKGRTIREFVTGVMLLPTVFSLIWYTVFGVSAMDIELNGEGGLVAQVNEEVAVALFVFLEHFPFSVVTSAIGVLIVVIFFTTSSDSASLVIDMLSSGGNPNPPARQRVFWAVSEGAVATVLLLVGGFDALQNVITTLGFPFCLLLIFMAFAMFHTLRGEEQGLSLSDLAGGRRPASDPAAAQAARGDEKGGTHP